MRAARAHAQRVPSEASPDERSGEDAALRERASPSRMKIKRLPYVLALHLKRFKFVDNQYKKLSYRVTFPFELRLFNTVRATAAATSARPAPSSPGGRACPKALRGRPACQSDDAEDSDRLYELFAVVVHIGRSGPNPRRGGRGTGLQAALPLAVLMRACSRATLVGSARTCSGPNQGHYITLVKSGSRWLIFDDDVVEVRGLEHAAGVCASVRVRSQRGHDGAGGAPAASGHPGARGARHAPVLRVDE